jgi:RHS repeat-associated protein
VQAAIVYTYDEFDAGAGQYGRGYRTGMSDASGSSSWVYDSRGRVSQEIQVISGSGTFTTQWGYNSADQVSWMKYPENGSGGLGEQVNYTYHPQGALDTAINSTGIIYVRASEYDASNRLDYRQLGESGGNFVLKVDYNYFAWTDANGQGRLQQIKSGIPTDLDSLQDLRFTYDAVGNVLTIQDYKAGSPQTQMFTYDDANRITSARASGGTGGTYGPTSYTYSAATGNLATAGSVTFTYGSASHRHAVTARSDGGTFGYDYNGNMTSRVIGGNSYTLGYESENRLVSVSGAATASFVYNGDGERVKGTVNGATVTYIGDYFEWKGSGSTKVKYYYAGGQRVAVRDSTVLYYLLTDHLGSTSITATNTGALYSELRYKAWGGERYSSVNETPTTFRFTGQRQQSQLGGADGLYYYGARWYDPSIMQFQSPDTLVPDPYNPLDWNRYSYARYNPVKYVDPNGREVKLPPCPWCNRTWWDYSGLDQRGRDLVTVVGTVGCFVIGCHVDPSNSKIVGPTSEEYAAQLETGTVAFGADVVVPAGPAAGGLVDDVARSASNDALSVAEGEFSILDWSTYPEGSVPRPSGPFRVLKGQEYADARAAADAANYALHESNPALRGLQIHEIHPVKFGGSPTDLSNKIALSPAEHIRYTSWWSQLLKRVGE